MIEAKYEHRYGLMGTMTVNVDGVTHKFKAPKKAWTLVTAMINHINEINRVNETLAGHLDKMMVISGQSNDALRSSLATNKKIHESHQRITAMHLDLVDLVKDRLGIEVDITTHH